MKANWKKSFIFLALSTLILFVQVVGVACSSQPLTNNNYMDYITISSGQFDTSRMVLFENGGYSYLNVNPKTIKITVSPIGSNYTYNEVKVKIKLKIWGKGYSDGISYSFVQDNGEYKDVYVEIVLNEFGNGETIIDAVAVCEEITTRKYCQIRIEYYEIVSSSGEIIALEDELQ